MKASVSYKTLDNITVVMLAFKNFKKTLAEEFVAVNEAEKSESNQDLLNKDSGQAGTTPAPEEQSQQPRPPFPVTGSPMGAIG